MNLPLSGSCRCERVQFRVTQAPVMTTACHCRGCQRMSSSAFSLTAIFPSAAFEVAKGEPVIGGLHGADAHHFFCGYCMTWMFTRPTALPDLVNVRPTMFDDHAWFSPFMETFTRNKLAWVATGAVRGFEEFPPLDAYQKLIQEFVAHTKSAG